MRQYITGFIPRVPETAWSPGIDLSGVAIVSSSSVAGFRTEGNAKVPDS
jgi:hypothetical protein